jgi:hypothetical protein
VLICDRSKASLICWTIGNRSCMQFSCPCLSSKWKVKLNGIVVQKSDGLLYPKWRQTHSHFFCCVFFNSHTPHQTIVNVIFIVLLASSIKLFSNDLNITFCKYVVVDFVFTTVTITLSFNLSFNLFVGISLKPFKNGFCRRVVFISPEATSSSSEDEQETNTKKARA